MTWNSIAFPQYLKDDPDKQLDTKFEQLNLLTQYIGPSVEWARSKGKLNTRKEQREIEIIREITSFMEMYTELIEY